MELLQQLGNSTFNEFEQKHCVIFPKKVEAELKKASKEKREPFKVIVKYSSPTGRPSILEQLDSMAETYLIAQSQRGCVINTSTTNAIAQALIQRFPQAVGNIGLKSTAWARSLFKRMGFVRRRKNSSKVEIPDAARKEIEFLFHHEIITYLETFKIPCSLILNLDQTPLKYVPVSQETMAPRSSTAVTIEGSNDKRMITGTFAITFSGKFLPIQLLFKLRRIVKVP